MKEELSTAAEHIDLDPKRITIGDLLVIDGTPPIEVTRAIEVVMAWRAGMPLPSEPVARATGSLVKYLHVPEGDAGGWVTFRPSLVRALLHMAKSDEPLSVLELGTGPGSSPMLAELAATGAVRVLAIESNPDYFELAYSLSLRSENYTPLVFDAPLEKLNASERFDVVLVDHAPVAARARDLATLAQMNVGLVVVHDWNCDVYGYDRELFRWCVEDRGRWPNTAILSNTVDLSSWLGYEPPPHMRQYTDTINAWEAAAQTAARSSHIHPTGVDAAAYEASGAAAAAQVRKAAMSFLTASDDAAIRILDYGCGDGRVLRHLNTLGINACGYDTSPAMRRAAAAACPGIPILEPVTTVADAIRPIVLSDVEVDLAFSFSVFIHHTQADGARMLAELASCVRPGGIVAVQIPLYDEPREPSSWTDVGVWTPRQMLAAATDAGLTVLELHTNDGAFSYDAVGPNHGRLQVLRRDA